KPLAYNPLRSLMNQYLNNPAFPQAFHENNLSERRAKQSRFLIQSHPLASRTLTVYAPLDTALTLHLAFSLLLHCVGASLPLWGVQALAYDAHKPARSSGARCEPFPRQPASKVFAAGAMA